MLVNLMICIKNGNCELPIKNFKWVTGTFPMLPSLTIFNFRQIMITLLKMIESQNQSVMIAALQTLSKIIRSPSMRPCWTNFLELILLKIIDSYKAGKEVSWVFDSFSSLTFHRVRWNLWRIRLRFNVKLTRSSERCRQSFPSTLPSTSSIRSLRPAIFPTTCVRWRFCAIWRTSRAKILTIIISIF